MGCTGNKSCSPGCGDQASGVVLRALYSMLAQSVKMLAQLSFKERPVCVHACAEEAQKPRSWSERCSPEVIGVLVLIMATKALSIESAQLWLQAHLRLYHCSCSYVLDRRPMAWQLLAQYIGKSGEVPLQ